MFLEIFWKSHTIFAAKPAASASPCTYRRLVELTCLILKQKVMEVSYLILSKLRRRSAVIAVPIEYAKEKLLRLVPEILVGADRVLIWLIRRLGVKACMGSSIRRNQRS